MTNENKPVNRYQEYLEKNNGNFFALWKSEKDIPDEVALFFKDICQALTMAEHGRTIIAGADKKIPKSLYLKSDEYETNMLQMLMIGYACRSLEMIFELDIGKQVDTCTNDDTAAPGS